MTEQISILLASGSPRRQEMLGWLELVFRAKPVDVDESPLPGETPAVYVSRLAETKARAAAADICDGELILAADTIVADGNDLLGKPANADAARKMLRQLRGRTHQVYTALALYEPFSDILVADLCISQVPMRQYKDSEIEAYIETDDPFDKAGGYAIQHASFSPVTNLQNCYACVMGLPLCHLVRSLRRFDINLHYATPHICQSRLEYACPIYETILTPQQVTNPM